MRRRTRRRLTLPDMLLLAGLGVLSLILAEQTKREVPTPYHDLKVVAATHALQAFQALKREFLRRGFEIDPVNDPSESGLIGLEDSPITTSRGYHLSKLTSINPNFAALIVEFLKELGIGEGDLVAVGMTGSFPALNICTLVAIETVGAVPIIIHSVGSSSFGANRPEWAWLDMETFLFQQGLIHFRTLAASYGGGDDIGRGLSPEGRTLMDQIIQRNGVRKIHVLPLQRSVDMRMALYREAAAGHPIRAYINIGGGIASLGSPDLSTLLRPGINRPGIRIPTETLPVQGVVVKFLEQGVPVIHLNEIPRLARRYQLPLAPAVMPLPGEGPLFYEMRYATPWVALILLGYLVLIFLTLYFDVWGTGSESEPMV